MALLLKSKAGVWVRRHDAMRMLVRCMLLLTAVTVRAQTAQFEEVGFQGYYRTSSPLRVAVQLNNPTNTPQAVKLLFGAHESQSVLPTADHSFSDVVTLQPGEHRRLDVPVFVSMYGKPFLDMEARLADERVIARAQRPLIAVGNEKRIVMLLCDDDAVCRQAQEKIELSGTPDEQAGKSKNYIFLLSHQPDEEWWAYAGIHVIVLTIPPSRLSHTQQTALEGYVRDGGQIVLIDPHPGDTAFLARYRPRDGSGPSVLGSGWLYQFPGVVDDLSRLFNQSVEQWLEKETAHNFREYQPERQGERLLTEIRPRLARTFVFPTLLSLLVWLSVYLLVVGVGNFALLRRLDRRELGWITTPAIAVLFALGLYYSSSAKRPKHLELDEVAIYAMDEGSPQAAMYADVRVSSPREDAVTVSLPAGPIWTGPDGALNPPRMDNPFDRYRYSDSGWSIDIGPQQRYRISLLQWSFRDLSFSDIKQFSGSVRRDGATRLVNETGRVFQDAIYRSGDKVYLLGPVASGATIDLAAARQEPFSLRFLNTSQEEDRRYEKELRGKPFSLRELLWRPKAQPSDASVFYGLADQSVVDAQLQGRDYEHKHFVVTVVTMLDSRD